MVPDSPTPPATRYPFGMPGWVGWPELLVLVVVLLLIFGPKRLPEMGRSVGKGLREFKDSISGKDEKEPSQVAELAEASDQESSGFCSSCGNPVTSGAQFCAKCGAPVAPAAYDAVVAARDAAPVERDS
jgi:sec-independent protein translocase protein TatA